MMSSNELKPSAFKTFYEFSVFSLRSPDVRLDVVPTRCPDISFDIVPSSGTPTIVDTYALTLLPVPKDSEIGGLLFRSILLVQLKRTQQGVMAETWLEGVYEYGTGQDDHEAITDLVISLREYLAALKRRKNKLGDSAQKELDVLSKLVRPKRLRSSGS